MMFKQQFKKLTIALFFTQIVLISGCATNKYTDALKASDGYSISDRDILEFNNHVRHMMRLKMKYATIAAYTASTVAVATATAATILTAGGAAGAVTIAALAGTSAFSANLMSIFSFSDVTVAYQSGVAIMEKAEAKYFIKIAITSEGKVPTDKLTLAAAQLYSQTVGALRLVERALANEIPTLDEVKQAIGEEKAFEQAVRDGNYGYFGSIKINPNPIELTERISGELPKMTIAFSSPPSRAISNKEEIFTINYTDKSLSAELKGLKSGSSHLFVSDDDGSFTKVNVLVNSPIKLQYKGNFVIGDNLNLQKNEDNIINILSISKVSFKLNPNIEKCTLKKENIIAPTDPPVPDNYDRGNIIIKCDADEATLEIQNKFEETRKVELIFTEVK